jgi:two-component system CheB/CheR fusion protein
MPNDDELAELMEALERVQRSLKQPWPKPAKRPDGRRAFTQLPAPLDNASGDVASANMLAEITGREFAGEVPRRLAAIVESANDAILTKNLDGIITSWNQGAQRIFGYTAEEIIGKSITTLIPTDRQHEETAILDRIRRGECIDPYETIRQRKDGSFVEISLTVSPIKNAEGGIVGASKIARDITKRRKSDRKTALLLDELDHRVKNILAVVSSVVSMTFKPGHTAEAYATEVEARIKAIAAAHNLLAQSEAQGEVSLRAIVTTELAPYGHDREATPITMTGPDITVASKAALGLAMAIHELASNAAKYGALSTTSGRLTITWEITDIAHIPALTLSWTETGGPKVEPPIRRGFGGTLIEEALTYNLHAKVTREFPAAGIHCTIAIPMKEIAFVETAGAVGI